MTTNDAAYGFDIAANGYTSYLADSYVKFVESAGGRAIPIVYNGDDSINKWTLRRVNALILPGGSAGDTTIEDPTLESYDDFAKRMYDYTKVRSNSTSPLPIMGIALGAQ